MDNFLELVNDREKFKEEIKSKLDLSAFNKLDSIKKEMANEFLTSRED